MTLEVEEYKKGKSPEEKHEKMNKNRDDFWQSILGDEEEPEKSETKKEKKRREKKEQKLERLKNNQFHTERKIEEKFLKN